MLAGLRYAVAVISIFSFTALILPLAVFVWDVLHDPSCLSLEVDRVAPVSGNAVRVSITLSYCSSIHLRDVRVQIGNRVVSFDHVTRGVHSKEVVLTLKDIEEGVRSIEFSVGGLYKVSVEMKKRG